MLPYWGYQNMTYILDIRLKNREKRFFQSLAFLRCGCNRGIIREGESRYKIRERQTTPRSKIRLPHKRNTHTHTHTHTFILNVCSVLRSLSPIKGEPARCRCSLWQFSMAVTCYRPPPPLTHTHNTHTHTHTYFFASSSCREEAMA